MHDPHLHTSRPRRVFLQRALALGSSWLRPSTSAAPLAGAIGGLFLFQPASSRAAERSVLEGAPFLTPELAQALGGSVVADDGRGDYALATRLADAHLERARKAGAGAALVDALCSRATIALLAGNPGQALVLLAEAKRQAGDDTSRLAWIEAYDHAAYARRHHMLPGGTTSYNADLLRQGRRRLPPADRPDLPATRWLGIEYASLPLLRDLSLRLRSPVPAPTYRLEEIQSDSLAQAPDAMRQRVQLLRADALRRSGRRAEALTALQAARAAFVQAQQWPAVLATELLEGDWYAAPLTTPEELNFFAADGVPPPWEAMELDTREVDLERARAAYQRAFEHARAQRAPRTLAALQLRQGLLARASNDLAGAQKLATQAMQAYDGCGDRFGYWTARWHAALARAATGRPSEDEGVAAALAQWGRGDGSYSHAWGLGLVGERAAWHGLLRSGSPEVYLTMQQLVEGLHRSLGAWDRLAEVSRLQATQLAALGDEAGAARAMSAAMEALDRRIAEHRGAVSPELAMTINLMSSQFIQALSALRQPDPLQLGADRISAHVARMRADAAALRLTESGAQRAANVEGAASSTEDTLRPVTARVAMMRGVQFLRNGDAKEAARQFAIVEEEAARPAGGMARSTLNALLFAVHRARRDYPAAAATATATFQATFETEQQYKDKMARLYPGRADDPDMLRALWSQQARLQHDLAFNALVGVRAFDGAARHLAALEQMAGPDWWRQFPQPWSERADCARLLAGQGRLDQAADAYREAIGLLENRRSGMRADVLKVAMAGQPAIASIYLDAALLALKRRERAADAAARRQLSDQAFEYLERVKARGLLDLLGGEQSARGAEPPGAASAQGLSSRLREWQRSRSRLSTWQALQVQRATSGARAASTQAYLQQKIDEEAAQLSRLEQDIARLAPPGSPWPTAAGQLLGPDQVAPLLPPRSVLLQIAVLDDDLVLCAVSASGEVTWHHAAVDAPGLRGDMRKLRFLYERRLDPREAGTRAARIAQRVLDPLDSVLAAHDHVVIVPHGPAYTVPFAALPWRGAPLAEQRSVAQIPSASVLPFLLRSAPLPRSGVLAIGNPAAMSYGEPPQSKPAPREPLVHAEAEARAVAARHEGSTLLTGAAATGAAVRSALPRHRILHLATHGVLSESAPLLSSLLLANGDTLSLDDLMGMQLNIDLAVLSACNTGGGKEGEGNDMLGFTRALMVAGVRSAVVSLWPVDDAATRLLMERFHAELRQGQGPASALRIAQMALRKMPAPATAAGGGASARYDDPYYWAAFVLVG